MSRVGPMQTAFNGGELSAFMLGRPDHDMWAISLAEMIGYAPRPQGPAEACPGFEYIGSAPGPCRLIAFEPDVTQGYVIEASANLFRFYTNDVLLEHLGATVTVTTPYSYAQLQALDWQNDDDVAYLFHGAVPTQLLERTAADAFTLSPAEFINGPFLDRNTDETLTLSFNGVAGTVTCTASDPLFAATDVGRLIEIEAHDLSNVASWEPGITVTLGQALQWDGRVYQVVGGSGRTGTVAPLHTHGVEWDGIGSGQDINAKAAGGVQLAYMHDMYGRLKITAYTNAQTVTATVTRTLPLQTASGYTLGAYIPTWYGPAAGYNGSLPADLPPDAGTTTAGTWRWRLGAFSNTTGFPSHGVIWNQRLVLAWRNKLFGSVAGSLLDFDRLNELGDVSVDQAFSVTLDDPAEIRWLFASAEMFIGTATKEYVLRAASAAQAFGPGNIKIDRQTKHGSAAVRPVDGAGRPIFLQRNQAKLLQVADDTYGKFKTEDLTRYADHIGNSAIVEMTWQREPLELLWAVREDGLLVSADYVPDEQVLGWWRRPLADGLTAKSICAITSPDGRRDQLWCAAQYGGAWFVMLLSQWRLPGQTDALPIMLDAALTYDGAPIDTLSMPHLAGQSVEVVGDGLWLGAFPVTAGGDIALGRTVSTAVAGLSYPGRLDILPIEAGGDNGPAQGKMKRISRVAVRLQNALGLRVTFDDATGERRNVVEIENTFPTTDLTEAIPLITRDVPLDIVGQWSRAGQLAIERVAPFPSSVLALMYVAETSER